MSLATIDNHARAIFDVLPELARSFPIVGGGALRAFFDHTPVKDYDLFFRSLADYETVLAVLRHAGWDEEPAPPGTAALRSPCGKLFNLIGFAFGSPWEHIDRFDFRCCALVAWLNDYGDVEVVCPVDAVCDATERRLFVRNNNGTARTLRRIDHYCKDYGYTLEVPEVPEDAEVDDETDDEDYEQPDTDVPVGTFVALVRYLKSLPKPAVSGGY